MAYALLRAAAGSFAYDTPSRNPAGRFFANTCWPDQDADGENPLKTSRTIFAAILTVYKDDATPDNSDSEVSGAGRAGRALSCVTCKATFAVAV